MKPIARGYVISVGRRYFWWHFTVGRGLNVEHEAQVAIAKLSPRERPFLAEGAYLNLLKGGTFRFCRLRWKARDLDRARKRANRLFRKLFEKR